MCSPPSGRKQRFRLEIDSVNLWVPAVQKHIRYAMHTKRSRNLFQAYNGVFFPKEGGATWSLFRVTFMRTPSYLVGTPNLTDRDNRAGPSFSVQVTRFVRGKTHLWGDTS